MPVYNEEKRLRESLLKVLHFCKKNFSAYEIIVVDDGSTDSTRTIVKSFNLKSMRLLTHYPNKGKGFSVKQGILSAKYPLVIFFDCDLSTPLTSILSMVKLAKKSEIIIASRNLKKSKIYNQSLRRKIFGRAFSYLVRFIVLPGIKDSQCGCKLMRTSIAKKLVKKLTIHRFAFDVELLYLAKRNSYSIREFPVVWTEKSGSKVHIFRDSFLMLLDILKILKNRFVGTYEGK